MKTPLLLALILALSPWARAQTPSYGTPIQVSVESEVKDLAKGYAAAFALLSRPPLTLVFQKEGNLNTLEDVKSVRAVDGVLVVEVGRGLLYVINPKDVVYLTDGNRIAPKPGK